MSALSRARASTRREARAPTATPQPGSAESGCGFEELSFDEGFESCAFLEAAEAEFTAVPADAPTQADAPSDAFNTPETATALETTATPEATAAPLVAAAKARRTPEVHLQSEVRDGLGATGRYALVATLYFPTGGSSLTGAHFPALWQIMDTYGPMLDSATAAEFGFAGWSDDRGPAAANEALALARADAVRSFFDDQLGGRPVWASESTGGVEARVPDGDGMDAALARRVDVTVFIDVPARPVAEVEAERREAERAKGQALLPDLLRRGSATLLAGNALDQETAKLMRLLARPGIGDDWLDAGDVRMFVLTEAVHRQVTPAQIASRRSAVQWAERAAARAGDDVDAFCYDLRALAIGIRTGLNESLKHERINGDTYASARPMLEFLAAKQLDPNHIYSAFKG